MPQRDLAFRLALLAAASSVLAACASLGTRPPRSVDLSGHWQLDESLSDDPRAMLRQQHRQGGGHVMHHHGGGMGAMGGMGGLDRAQLVDPGGGARPPGQYGSHHGGANGGNGGRHGPAGDFLARPDKLSIQQGATELKLLADGVSTDFVYGEKVMASVQGGAAERRAGWKGQNFVVEYAVSDGPRATRDYELDDGGKQLVVTTQLTGHGSSLKFRTVYERASG